MDYQVWQYLQIILNIFFPSSVTINNDKINRALSFSPVLSVLAPNLYYMSVTPADGYPQTSGSTLPSSLMQPHDFTEKRCRS